MKVADPFVIGCDDVRQDRKDCLEFSQELSYPSWNCETLHSPRQFHCISGYSTAYTNNTESQRHWVIVISPVRL